MKATKADWVRMSKRFAKLVRELAASSGIPDDENCWCATPFCKNSVACVEAKAKLRSYRKLAGE